MSIYYEIWRANETSGLQVVMVLVLGSLALVAGWLLIPVLMPKRIIVAARWGYVVMLFMLAVTTATWWLR